MADGISNAMSKEGSKKDAPLQNDDDDSDDDEFDLASVPMGIDAR